MQVEETTPSTPLRPTRAGFVRGLPLTMPVEEVIERGREAGIELQPSDIHAARYYMRQVGAGDSSSIPQQLLLGGTFVTKREPRKGAGARDSNGATAKAASPVTNGSATVKLDKVQAARGGNDEDDELDFEEDAEPVVVTKVKGRGRAAQTAKLTARTANVLAKEAKAAKATQNAGKEKSGNGLHSRLQARLRNATFRDTAKDERNAKRDEKATIGKALLDVDALKPRGKRAAQTAEALEQQVRLIALRVGTQRVRELLDEMEALAARA